MARVNVPLLALNRGVISPKALARVDIDRTALSAAQMDNFVPKSQGAMTIRPGTKYLGSTFADSGAALLEFVASVSQIGLLELTKNKMRVWDTGDKLIARPAVASLSGFDTDTGSWTSASTSGGTMTFGSNQMVLNATNVGGLAKAVRRVTLADTGEINVEHALAINVARGPVVFRCGSDTGGDDYIGEATLKTGRHSLAFTPTAAEFHMTFQSDRDYNIQVGSIGMDTGTMELTTPWTANDVLNVRADQSADVVFCAATGIRPQRIERRGTGRSWSVVDYRPPNGPFLTGRTSNVRLKVSATYGDITLTSDLPFFTSDHVGSIFRLSHGGQSGVWNLGREDTVTDVFAMTGIGDTGTGAERAITIVTSGTWTATITVERSYDGADFGFHDEGTTITTNTTTVVRDPDDNVDVWYRLKIKTGDYTSGTAVCTVTYPNGSKTGVILISGFTNSKTVTGHVLKRFSSTDYTDNWNEAAWSDEQGFPDAVALAEGRLWWAGGTYLYGSVSDDYENFDDTTEGDAGPITRSIGRGPVNTINFLLPGPQLVVGTAGSELAVLASSLGETLTPSNTLARTISTQGSAALRALLVDTQGVFVQRSSRRIFALSYDPGATSYAASDLTKLVPDLLTQGVVALAVQRQPDTRIHFVLADGTAAMLTYDPAEELLAWSTWSTDGTIENVAVLPGDGEDRVYFIVKRTINSVAKRYLERMATESECSGGVPSWIADCAVNVVNDTGSGETSITGLGHLEGEAVVAWGNDTGQATYGKDLTPDDTGGHDTQQTFTVTGGAITLPQNNTNVVVGLPYTAKYQTTKLAYGAALGTALTQLKRVSQIGFILDTTHNNGLYYGPDFTAMDSLPRSFKGATVDADKVHATLEMPPFSFPGLIDADSRICLKGKAPRPVTVLAAVPGMETTDKA